MRTFSTILFATTMISTAMMPSGALALADQYSCEVVERRFICAGGARTQWKVVAAMANPETIENINSAERGDRLLADPKERERFRLSVERARKKLIKYSKRQYRKYRRNRMHPIDYAKVRERYEAAMNSYYSAMGLFHSKEWFSESMDTQAEGDELKRN